MGELRVPGRGAPPVVKRQSKRKEEEEEEKKKKSSSRASQFRDGLKKLLTQDDPRKSGPESESKRERERFG